MPLALPRTARLQYSAYLGDCYLITSLFLAFCSLLLYTLDCYHTKENMKTQKVVKKTRGQLAAEVHILVLLCSLAEPPRRPRFTQFLTAFIWRIAEPCRESYVLVGKKFSISMVFCGVREVRVLMDLGPISIERRRGRRTELPEQKFAEAIQRRAINVQLGRVDISYCCCAGEMPRPRFFIQLIPLCSFFSSTVVLLFTAKLENI